MEQAHGKPRSMTAETFPAAPGTARFRISPRRATDIENSPLTNTMPILRHRFQLGGSGDFVMAFVTTPGLRVEASPQRYEHVRVAGEGSVVRYLSRDGDFTAELELDADGLLAFDPRLARRVQT